MLKGVILRLDCVEGCCIEVCVPDKVRLYIVVPHET